MINDMLVNDLYLQDVIYFLDQKLMRRIYQIKRSM